MAWIVRWGRVALDPQHAVQSSPGPCQHYLFAVFMMQETDVSKSADARNTDLDREAVDASLVGANDRPVCGKIRQDKSKILSRRPLPLQCMQLSSG